MRQDGEEATAQLNLGFYPAGDAYFYSTPWPFDESLLDYDAFAENPKPIVGYSDITALLLAIAIVSVFGPGLRNALIAIAVVSTPAYARVMRAQVLAIKEADFVAASEALGASPTQILVRRVIPNALTPLVVLATLGIASAILEAAGLSFLGLGAQPPMAEWGSMLASERSQVFTSPHLVFFPGLAIMITVLGFNLMGDGLRDALDPTLNR